MFINNMGNHLTRQDAMLQENNMLTFPNADFLSTPSVRACLAKFYSVEGFQT